MSKGEILKGKWIIGDLLGEGSFGKVYNIECIGKKYQYPLVVKICYKRKNNKDTLYYESLVYQALFLKYQFTFMVKMIIYNF